MKSLKYVTPKFVNLNTRDPRNITMIIHIDIKKGIKLLQVSFRKL